MSRPAYIQWPKPRRFAVKGYGKWECCSFASHITLGVVAMTINQAIEAAQARHPDYRMESAIDTGEVDIVCGGLEGLWSTCTAFPSAREGLRLSPWSLPAS